MADAPASSAGLAGSGALTRNLACSSSQSTPGSPSMVSANDHSTSTTKAWARLSGSRSSA